MANIDYRAIGTFSITGIMIMDIAAAGEKLFFLFEQKLFLLNQYLSITRKLFEKMRVLGHDHSTKLVYERQHCIQQIQVIDQSINRFTRRSEKKYYP